MSAQPPPDQPPTDPVPPDQPTPRQPAQPPADRPPAAEQPAQAVPPSTELPPAQPAIGAAQPQQPPPGAPAGPPPGGYRPPPGSLPPMQPGVPAGPPPAAPRKRGGGLTCLIIVIIVAVVGCGGLALMMTGLRGAGAGTPPSWPGSSGDAVGVIKITGLITSGGQISPLFGATAGSESITSQFRTAARDRSVKALVVRINSPGGSAAASQEIFQAVQEYKKETSDPVIVSMGDVAASGGYYVAAPADKIVALPATMTGSIGVIVETIEYHGLMDKVGVKGNTMTSGKLKDMGSPFRSMTDEEREIFKAMIDDVYDQFVEAVVEGRGMEKEEVKKLADGRVYTGRQAQEVGLVDELGTFRDAIRIAASDAGIKGEPTVKFFGRVSLLSALTGELDSMAPQHFPPGLLFDSRLWPVADMLLEQQPMPRFE